MQKIPIEFNSAEEYINIFEPLLMEEILSQLERGKEESGFAFSYFFRFVVFSFPAFLFIYFF